MSDILFFGGIVICGISVLCAIGAIVFLRIFKLRLSKRLDIEYGKRRH